MRALFVVVALAIRVIAIADGVAESDNEFAIRYLRRYGYLNEQVQSFRTTADQRALRHAIGLFQEYYKLPNDGALNAETLNRMRRPRCGLQDVLNLATDVPAMKWPKKHLTWNFHLASKAVLEMTRVAFDLWQNETSLTFERDVTSPNILISWREGRHVNLDPRNGEVCSSPLDGPGGVLAHAAFPIGLANFTSEVHIDKAEPWHIFLNRNPLPNTLNLLQTIAHEIGHSLGLPHSQREDSIMYAYVTGSSTFDPVALSNEDILSVQNLYGSRDATPTPTTTTTTTTTPATPVTTPETPEATPRGNVPTDLCALKRVDAILLMDKRMYIARGRYVWSLDLEENTYGEPMLLSNYMRFLRPNYTRVSAAYQAPSGHIVLFADDRIYKVNYPSFTLAPNWPKTYAEFGLPEDARINTAVSTNKGRSYVIYNDYVVGEVNDCSDSILGYHSIQAIFPGVPPGVSTAFRYLDGNLYFVIRRQFLAFNEFTRTIGSAGRFDLRVVGVTCPRHGLLQQLRDLLERIARTSNAITDSSDDGDDYGDDEDPA